MSIIVAVKKSNSVAVAWDTLTTIGSRACAGLPQRKVVEWEGIAIGAAGLSVYYNVMEHYLSRLPKPDRAILTESDVLEFFIGFWRSLREDYHFVDNQADSDDPCPFADLGTEFLLATPSAIYGVREILSVSEHERFVAVGSGASHAEGACSVLYDQLESAREIAEATVAVALRFDRSSGEPIQSIELTP